MFNFLFRKSISGLDIVNNQIRFVELYKNSKGVFLSKYGELKIPEEIFISKEIIDEKFFKKFLLSVVKKNKLKKSVFSLPNENKTELIAVSIIKRGDMNTYMVINFGPDEAELFIYSKGKILFSVIFDIKNKSSDKIKDEIMRNIVFWHKNINSDESCLINKVLLCGQGFNLKKLSEYLSVSLKIKVEVANVWINIFDTRHIVPSLELEKSAAYASAIGLVLKELK